MSAPPQPNLAVLARLAGLPFFWAALSLRAMAEVFAGAGSFLEGAALVRGAAAVPAAASPASGTTSPDPSLPQPSSAGPAARAATSPTEDPMTDRSLNDDMVKLVRYSIVTIERDKEAILVSRAERLVTDNLSDDAFASWMISEHREQMRGTANQYLRVSFEVIDRWAKQDRKYEKRQLEILGEIRDRMPLPA